MDLAIAVVMGTAFKAILVSIVADIITPILGIILGGVDFSELFITLGNTQIKYGAFIQASINFILISIVIFLMIHNINKLQEKLLGKKEKKVPTDIALLTQIRDLLKKDTQS